MSGHVVMCSLVRLILIPTTPVFASRLTCARIPEDSLPIYSIPPSSGRSLSVRLCIADCPAGGMQAFRVPDIRKCFWHPWDHAIVQPCLNERDEQAHPIIHVSGMCISRQRSIGRSLLTSPCLQLLSSGQCHVQYERHQSCGRETDAHARSLNLNLSLEFHITVSWDLRVSECV